jgi:hypothetical protein
MTLTWNDITQLEPRLLSIYEEAAALNGDKPRFCAYETWLRDFKTRVGMLVGWHRKDMGLPVLATVEAYHVSTIMIMSAFPKCRGCDCAGVSR